MYQAHTEAGRGVPAFFIIGSHSAFFSAAHREPRARAAKRKSIFQIRVSLYFQLNCNESFVGGLILIIVGEHFRLAYNFFFRIWAAKMQRERMGLISHLFSHHFSWHFIMYASQPACGAAQTMNHRISPEYAPRKKKKKLRRWWIFGI